MTSDVVTIDMKSAAASSAILYDCCDDFMFTNVVVAPAPMKLCFCGDYDDSTGTTMTDPSGYFGSASISTSLSGWLLIARLRSIVMCICIIVS